MLNGQQSGVSCHEMTTPLSPAYLTIWTVSQLPAHYTRLTNRMFKLPYCVVPTWSFFIIKVPTLHNY